MNLGASSPGLGLRLNTLCKYENPGTFCIPVTLVFRGKNLTTCVQGNCSNLATYNIYTNILRETDSLYIQGISHSELNGDGGHASLCNTVKNRYICTNKNTISEQ